MPIGLVGRKAGMTRVFTDAGDSIPVTVDRGGAESRDASQGHGRRTAIVPCR